MFAKPWEKNPPPDKTVVAEKAKSARRAFSRAVTDDTTRRMDKDIATAIAREYVKHADMFRALVAVGYCDEDTDPAMMSKIAGRVRKNAYFEKAFSEIVTTFTEHEVLTRDRILAGLYIEAADRFGPTTGSSRVAAWSKLAMLTGLEAEAKRAAEPDAPKQLEAPGGVLLIPFAPSVEAWEQAAIGQQAQLKADVRT